MLDRRAHNGFLVKSMISSPQTNFCASGLLTNTEYYPICPGRTPVTGEARIDLLHEDGAQRARRLEAMRQGQEASSFQPTTNETNGAQSGSGSDRSEEHTSELKSLMRIQY